MTILSNIVTVTGTRQDIRSFLESDSTSLTPPSAERQVALDPHHHIIKVNATDVELDLYATDIGITQLTNFGLTVEIERTAAERQAHFELVRQEIAGNIT